MRSVALLVICLYAIVGMTSVNAGVPLITSYQGRLLGSDDQPVSGTFTLTFQIYDALAGCALLWTEDHVGVQVTDGLFTVELGTTVPLSADLLAGNGGGGGGGGVLRYLQIQVAGQQPISPRTPLTAAPYAVASGSLAGDVKTAPGHVTIGGSNGAKTMVFSATDDSASMTINESGAPRVKINSTDGSGGGAGGMIGITGDPDFDLLRLSATPDSAKIRISGQSSGDPDFDLLRIVAGKGNGDGGMISITGDPDFDLLRLSANPDSAKIRLGGKITGDPDFDLLRLAGGSGGSQLLMQSEPTGVDARSQSLDAACDNNNSRLVMQSKGQITQNSQSLRCSSSADPDAATTLLEADLDGDGVMENTSADSVDANGASRRLRSSGIGSSGNDGVEIDLSARRKGMVTITASQNTQSLKCSSSADSATAMTLLEADSDGDGIPEGEISSSVTPTTCGVAINTKGTGAAKGRTISSTTDTAKAVTVHSADTDGDGLADRVIRQQCDNDDAGITVTRETSEIKIRHKGWDGTIKGRMAIEQGGSIQVDFAGDGFGFVSQRFGVGVLTPTHPIEHSSGAHLTAGGVWTNASDVCLKENFQPVDGIELLEKIAELPISQWNYKTESCEVKHIGPTAQDFRKTFGVGSDGKSISTIDPSGIALAAIKELNRQNQNLKSENENLKKQLEALSRKVEKLAAGK